MSDGRLTPGQLLYQHRIRHEAAENGILRRLNDVETVKWKSLNHDQQMKFVEQIYGGMDAALVAAMFKNYAETMQQEELGINA